MTAVRELLAWSKSELAGIESMLRPCWTGWLADWDLVGSSSTASCVCRPAHDVEVSVQAWCTLGSQRGGCWLSDRDAFEVQIAQQLFDRASESPGRMSRQIVDATREELEGRLGAALVPFASRQLEAEPAQELTEWSGGVIVEFAGGSLRLRVLVSGLLVQELLPPIQRTQEPMADPAAMARALLDMPTLAHASLRPASLSLGAMLQLEVGDVLHLGHPLTDPLVVTVDGVPVCGAHLGRRGITKAVSLTH